MSEALDVLVTEVARRGHYLGIIVHPPKDLLSGVIVYVEGKIEDGPDRCGGLKEIAKSTASSIDECARRLLENKKWQR